MAAPVEEEYESLLQFLYIAPIGLMQTRLDGEIVMVNPLCAQLLMPLSRDGNLSNLFVLLEPLAPDLQSRASDYMRPYGMVCDAMQLEIRAGQTANKNAQFLSLSLLKLDSERMMAVLSDVTQAVVRERELRRSQALINTIATGITDYALLSLDGEGNAQTWNAGVARLTGFDSAATLGRSPAIFYPADAMSPERVLDRLHEADHTGWSLDEGWRVRCDGTRYWGSCLIAPLHTPDESEAENRAYSLILRDISEQKEAREDWRQSIYCDHLTGLANRRAFFESAELELLRWERAPRPLSVVMIDADHFKAVNDTHGHAAGDAVLRHLAASMNATFRTIDLIARIGGEEFVVLLPGTTVEGAELVAVRLADYLAQHPALVEGSRIAYTVSAGVAAMEAGISSVQDLLKRADAALYTAKSRGRNRVERWQAELPTLPLAILPS